MQKEQVKAILATYMEELEAVMKFKEIIAPTRKML